MGGRARSSTRRDFAELEACLGHAFRDPALLKRALSHSSAGPDSNERLEFFGDRVLGLVIAARLYEMYPNDTEGKLALKFNALVRKEACAAAAEAAGLPEHLVLANSEAGSGGRKKAVILAGACEAITAALYLDGGLAAARGFIDRYWCEAISALNEDMRDAKTALQEWAQSGPVKATPLYRLLRREGPDHAPSFVVEVRAGEQDPVRGEGRSKREAEQAAAKSMLVRVGLWQA
jgi:ribonuclease III